MGSREPPSNGDDLADENGPPTGDEYSSGNGRPVFDGLRAGVVDWVLLYGNRQLVAAGLTAGFAASFAAFVLLGLVPLVETQALFYAYSGLIAGNLTLITVVVSINQLLLSRELQSPDELRSQIEGVVDYREEVEAATGEIAPVKPLGFLRLLLEATREEAQRLGGFARDGVVASGHDEIDDVVTGLTDRIDRIDGLLVESRTDTFSVLSLLLETNYAEQIRRLRRLQAAHGADFAEEVHESIDDLVDRLREIDVARQYFKSIYLQQELSTLSRVLLYAGLPAVGVALVSLLALTVPADRPGLTVDLRLFVPVTFTIGLVPLATLCSYVLRAASVTKLTAATLPFTTPEQER